MSSPGFALTLRFYNKSFPSRGSKYIINRFVLFVELVVWIKYFMLKSWPSLLTFKDKLFGAEPAKQVGHHSKRLTCSIVTLLKGTLLNNQTTSIVCYCPCDNSDIQRGLLFPTVWNRCGFFAEIVYIPSIIATSVYDWRQFQARFKNNWTQELTKVIFHK